MCVNYSISFLSVCVSVCVFSSLCLHCSTDPRQTWWTYSTGNDTLHALFVRVECKVRTCVHVLIPCTRVRFLISDKIAIVSSYFVGLIMLILTGRCVG
jgi:hypothetical protein